MHATRTEEYFDKTEWYKNSIYVCKKVVVYMSHFGDKRGVLNCAKSSVVCNASATNFQIIADFSVVFGYANDNFCFQRENLQTTG